MHRVRGRVVRSKFTHTEDTKAVVPEEQNRLSGVIPCPIKAQPLIGNLVTHSVSLH